MLPIDLSAVRFLNQFAGASRGFDSFMVEMAYDNLLKFGPIMAAFYALWFSSNPADVQRRARLASCLVACCVAAVLSVALTHVLPLRPRPMIDPQLGFVLPFGMSAEGWDRISSLPSDHAALFFALAGGLWFVSRRWGCVALLYAVLLIALPRAYLGLHYASDLAAGATIGLALTWLGNRPRVLRFYSQRVLKLEASRPDIFYAALFLLTYQVANLFHESRTLLYLVKRMITGNW